MRILEGHRAAVRGVAFAPDGRTLASASYDGTVRLWDVAAGREALTLNGSAGGGRSAFLCVAFSPDGGTLGAGEVENGYGHANLWPFPSGGRAMAATIDRIVFALAFSPNGKLLATAGGVAAALDVPLASFPTVFLGFPPSPAMARCVAFAPDGNSLAVGTETFGWPISAGRNRHTRVWGEVRVWNLGRRAHDLRAGEERTILQGHDHAVTSLAFSPDGALLASGSADRTVRLWDPATGQERVVLRGHAMPVQCVAFSPDGRTLASAGTDAVVRLWDVASGSERAVYDWGIGLVNCVAFAPDGMTAAAAGSSGAVFLWDVDDLH